MVKTQEQIQHIKEATQVVAKVHRELKAMIKPGVKLIDLDNQAKEIIEAEEATSTFLGYNGFPAHICTSVNQVMVHGIPTDYELKEGDIISIDVGAKKNRYCGDAAFTMAVGEISPRAQELLGTSKKALDEAIKAAKPGVTTSEIGKIVETIAASKGFSVPTDFVGHGIGKEMHEEPTVPNFPITEGVVTLEEGMTICIEPMLIDGPDDLIVDPFDNWSVYTKHKGLTAHDEHTILITKNGGEILSK